MFVNKSNIASVLQWSLSSTLDCLKLETVRLDWFSEVHRSHSGECFWWATSGKRKAWLSFYCLRGDCHPVNLSKLTTNSRNNKHSQPLHSLLIVSPCGHWQKYDRLNSMNSKCFFLSLETVHFKSKGEKGNRKGVQHSNIVYFVSDMHEMFVLWLDIPSHFWLSYISNYIFCWWRKTLSFLNRMDEDTYTLYNRQTESSWFPWTVVE